MSRFIAKPIPTRRAEAISAAAVGNEIEVVVVLPKERRRKRRVEGYRIGPVAALTLKVLLEEALRDSRQSVSE